MTELAGPGAALVTLRSRDGTVDELAIERLARAVTARGATMLLVAGTTGESHTLTLRERIQLTRAAATAGRPVVTAVPATATRRLIDDLARAGATALLAAPDTSDAFERLIAVSVTAELPLLGYHHPRTGATLSIDRACAAAAAGMAGVKDSAGTRESLHAFTALDVPVYVGGTPLLSTANAAGATGLLTGLGSARPDVVARAWTGDTDAQALLDAYERDHPDRTSALKTAAARLAATS